MAPKPNSNISLQKSKIFCLCVLNINIKQLLHKAFAEVSYSSTQSRDDAQIL